MAESENKDASDVPSSAHDTVIPTPHQQPLPWSILADNERPVRLVFLQCAHNPDQYGKYNPPVCNQVSV